jgi:hypothetical protein
MKYLYTLCLLLLPSLALAVEGFNEQNLNSPARFYLNTHNSFGDAADADAAPTYSVYEQSTGTPLIDDADMVILDATNTDGFYTGVFTPTTALGFAIGETYCLRIEGVVDTATGVDVTTFKVVGQLENRVQDALSFRFDVLESLINAVSADAASNSTPTATFTAGSSGGGTAVANVATLDGVYHRLLAESEGDPLLEVVYTFALPTGAFGSSLGLYYLESDVINQVTIEIYNTDTSTWDNAGLTLSQTDEGVQFATTALSAEYTGNNQVRVRFSAEDTFQGQSLYIDKASVSYSVPLATFIENNFALVPGLVWGADLDDYEAESNVAAALLPVATALAQVTAQGAENLGVFFNNGEALSTQTLSNLTVGSSESGISPRYETEGRVWKFTRVGQLTGKPNIIELNSYDGLLVMDLDSVLSPNVSLLSAEVVSVTNEEDIDVGTPLLLSPNKRKVHIVADTSTPNTYEFVIKVTTTDSQSFNKKGILEIK